jgi:hypothetical protein
MIYTRGNPWYRGCFGRRICTLPSKYNCIGSRAPWCFVESHHTVVSAALHACHGIMMQVLDHTGGALHPMHVMYMCSLNCGVAAREECSSYSGGRHCLALGNMPPLPPLPPGPLSPGPPGINVELPPPAQKKAKAAAIKRRRDPDPVEDTSR